MLQTLKTSAASPVLDYLKYFVHKGGPDPHEYVVLDDLIRYANGKKLKNELPDSVAAELKELLGEEVLNNTLQGRALLKPLGYAGDYQMIDYIYTHKVSDKKNCRKWDLYFHRQHAPIAVRNRKEYFKQTMAEIVLRHQGELELLNVANGPARDLAELYAGLNSAKLKTTCIDMDAQAIEYAKEMTAGYEDSIEFIHRNIFKFTPEKKFDVIWSAGLFDYFDDKTFVFILNRFLGWLKEGGEIIIGNFSDHNPSRAYMELFGEWFLNHRSESHLIELAKKAGAIRCLVEKEPMGVNLFLRAKAPVLDSKNS